MGQSTMSGDEEAGPWAAGTWLNRPRRVGVEDGALTVVTDAQTDFWRETHYGFTRDSGHFLGFAAPCAFMAQVRVQARYEALYDQAGLMVRLDEKRWVKAGIELSDGAALAGSVLTDGASDWATGPFEGDPTDVWVRATVSDGVLRLQVSEDGRTFRLLRLAPFPRGEACRVGPMCCTPEREGLAVRFSDWKLGPPLGRDLHNLN